MTFPSSTLSSVYGFAKGSRGGTWHVPRGTWRHVTNAIVVPALWRIFWCLSRPDRPSRSGVIHESPWTSGQTHKQARPSYKNPPSPEEISIHQNGLTPILLHYDFELVSGIISYCLVSKIVIVSIKRFENQNFENSKF